MYKKGKILFFCMIFVVKIMSAQKTALKFSPISTTFRELNHSKSTYNAKPSQPLIAVQKVTYSSTVNFPIAAFSVISPNYYTQNFGFFCKKELQMEKVTKLPIKIRLGSVQQCDWMEGKPNAVRGN